MFIPGIRILGEMQSVQGLIRYVPSTGDDDVALVVKTLTPSIKAAVMGCMLELFLYKRDKYICVGIKIYDVPEMPIYVYTIGGLKDVLFSSISSTHCFLGINCAVGKSFCV